MGTQNFTSFYNSSNILMCPPTYFQPINSHPKYGFPNEMSEKGYEIYKGNPKAFKKKSFEQWKKLYELLQKLFLNVELLDPVNDSSDQVFTADASLTLCNQGKDVTVISKFTHWGRSQETVSHKKKIANIYPQRSIHFMSEALEGAGDNLYDYYRDCFWSGYSSKLSLESPSGGRSSLSAHKILEEYTGVSIKSLEVIKPFFHLDTAFSPLTRGHILYYPKGLSETAQSFIKSEAIENFDLNASQYLIPVSEEEALCFACNVINIGNIVIMNDCGKRLPKKLREYGYDVYVLDLSCFIKAGGGPHCLINNINQTRVVGGLSQQINFQGSLSSEPKKLKKIEKLQSTSSLFMIEPVNFYPNPETIKTNSYQINISKSLYSQVQKSAQIEHKNLRRLLRSNDVNITTIKGRQDTPDDLFCNNWISTHTNKSYNLYPMLALNRRKERNSELINFFDKHYKLYLDFTYGEKENKFLESTGSLVLDRVNSRAYAVKSPRTNEELILKWCQRMFYTPIIFNCLEPTGLSIYHTNVMMFIGTKIAAVYLAGIPKNERKEVQKKLEETHQLIELNYEQIKNFSGNALEVQSKHGRVFLVMSQSGYKALNKYQRSTLEGFYDKILYTDLKTIEAYGGGSARCLLLELF